MIRVLSIIHDSIVDGEGLRTVIFFAGCPHRCYGCHNPESWNSRGGENYRVENILDIIHEYPDNDITFSGGDPMMQAEQILPLAKELKQLGKNIWCYTGYTLEEIIEGNNRAKQELLSYIDMLIDGRFEHKLKDMTLSFKGSHNQRIIPSPSRALIGEKA